MFSRQEPHEDFWGRFGSRRLVVLLAVACYVLLFLFNYQDWLSPTFGYFGFTYTSLSPAFYTLAWALCLVPCFWMPLDLSRPSMLIYWILYLLVYIPTMFIPYMVRLMPPEDVTWLVLTLALGYFLTGLCYRVPLIPFRRFKTSPRLFWACFTGAALLMVLTMLVLFRGKMKLVSIEDVYGQRAEAKAIMKDSSVGYIVMLLQGMVAPVLLSLGLVKKRYTLFGAGVVIQILVYACTASKAAMASIVFSVVFYFLMRGRERGFGLNIAWSMAAMMAFLLIANQNKAATTTGFIFKLSSLLLMRTVGTPGLLAAQYQAFFANHPFTYYSHVNGISLLFTYPYSQPLGVTVGSYFTGNVDLNANASMWFTDGVAACGLPGILIVSMLASMTFWVVDSAAQRQSVTFAALTLVFAGMDLANVSLFTTLVSGGLLSLTILFLAMPSETREMAIARRSSF